MGWGNKYKAKRTELAGYSFASKGEAAMFSELKLLERAGLLKDIQVQDHVYLTDAEINYIVDFKAYDCTLNQYVWIEFKGVEVATYRIKRKLWMFYGPGILRVYKSRGGKPFLFEEIIPKTIKASQT